MSQSTTQSQTHEEERRFQYRPVPQTVFSEELGSYIETYGICAQRLGVELLLISDVSTDLEKVQRLADILTANDLYPEHLLDVIEDFLADEDLLRV